MPKLKNLYRNANVNLADETARIVGLDNATIAQRCRAYAESLGLVNVVTIRPATQKELAALADVMPYETPESIKYYKDSQGKHTSSNRSSAVRKAKLNKQDKIASVLQTA